MHETTAIRARLLVGGKEKWIESLRGNRESLEGGTFRHYAMNELAMNGLEVETDRLDIVS